MIGSLSLKQIHDSVSNVRAISGSWRALSSDARRVVIRDFRGVLPEAPSISNAIDSAIGWLCNGQDYSRTQDGGVARDFSLSAGWNTSYPETTGYIVPTFLEYAVRRRRDWAYARAERMVDWLVSIQLECGAFQGGRIDSKPKVPVVFNTGQILLGLAAGTEHLGGKYADPMRRAADWLVQNQDTDGCWRKFASPFARAGEKAYDTHTSWGLLEAARIDPDRGYAEAALANIRWALRSQLDNGWFDNCCLTEPRTPLTHTLGYALRGVVEAYRYSKQEEFLEASLRTADSLLAAMRSDGFLPGQLDRSISAAARWSCLTGTVQIARCWLMLYRMTGIDGYREAGSLANRFVRRTLAVRGPVGIRGGIRGSFPIFGEYGRMQFLSWGAKFFVDSHLLEQEINSLAQAKINQRTIDGRRVTM